MHQMSLDRHFASVGTRPKLGQPQLSFRSSLQLPPSAQVMASRLLNDHKNDERVGRLLSTYVGVDKRSGASGLLIRRAVTKKAKQQQLKLALSKRQDKPKEEKVMDSADDLNSGAITEPISMFQLEASFGDPRQSSMSPDRTSLEKEIEKEVELMQMSTLIDEKVRSDFKGRRKQPRSKFLTALDHSAQLNRKSSGSLSPVGNSSVNLAMNAANEGRLMCIPKCTHTGLLEHIPAAAYLTNDYLPKSKKSSRSPRLKAQRNPEQRSKSPALLALGRASSQKRASALKLSAYLMSPRKKQYATNRPSIADRYKLHQKVVEQKKANDALEIQVKKEEKVFEKMC